MPHILTNFSLNMYQLFTIKRTEETIPFIFVTKLFIIFVDIVYLLDRENKLSIIIIIIIIKCIITIKLS